MLSDKPPLWQILDLDTPSRNASLTNNLLFNFLTAARPKTHLFITLAEDLPPRQSPVLSDHILEGIWGNSCTSLDIIFH